MNGSTSKKRYHYHQQQHCKQIREESSTITDTDSNSNSIKKEEDDLSTKKQKLTFHQKNNKWNSSFFSSSFVALDDNDDNDNDKVKKLSSSSESIPNLLNHFSSLSPSSRFSFLNNLINHCSLAECSFLHHELQPKLKRDFIAQLPFELSTRILSFLDPFTLCRLARVNSLWYSLTKHNVVWVHLCQQHILKKCTQCECEELPLLHSNRKKWYQLWDSIPPLLFATTTLSNLILFNHHHHHHHHQAHEQPNVCFPSSSSSSSSSTTSPFSITEFWNHVTQPSTLFSTTHTSTPTKDSLCIKKDLSLSSSSSSSSSLCHSSESSTHTTLSNSITSYHSKENKDTTTTTSTTIPTPSSNSFWKQVFQTRFLISKHWKHHTPRHFLIKKKQPLTHPSRSDLNEPTHVFDHFPPRIHLAYFHDPILVTATLNGKVTVWHLGLMQRVHEFYSDHVGGLTCLFVDPMKCITGGLDGCVRIWNPLTATCLRVLEAHPIPITCLHGQETVVVSGDASSLVRVWQFESQTCFTLCHGNLSKILQVQLTLPYLISLGEDNVIRVWDLNTRHCVRSLKPMLKITCFHWNNEDPLWLLGTHDGTVKMYPSFLPSSSSSSSSWSFTPSTSSLPSLPIQSVSSQRTRCIIATMTSVFLLTREKGTLLHTYTFTQPGLVRVSELRLVCANEQGNIEVFDFTGNDIPVSEHVELL